MKKSLALVLALIMVLSSFSFVSAAPDFADVKDTKYENAVARLELLEILKGYPDGTFKPEGSITRAEFAAVAVRAKGLAGVAEAAAGLPSGFSDVPAWHWAAGYVGTAGSTGVVQGIGGGLFAPNAPVKYEEAVTMLVRALGYEPDAQSKGGYPYGYLVVAEEIGLLDGARSTTGTFATRGLVALLTDNALEIPMMVSIGFGDNIRWVVSGSKEHGGNEVYLLNALGVDEVEGIVMKNFRVDSKLDAEEIVLYDLNDEKNITMEVSANVDIDAVLGLEVTAWAKDDVVFAMTVESDNVAYDTVSGTATADDVYLTILDDSYEWAVRDEDYGNATVYVNNESVDAEEAVGYGRFVMNSDDEIVFAYLFDFDDYGFVTEIDTTDMEYVSVTARDEDLLELDAAEAVYVFTKEFAATGIDGVKEDMSVFYWIDADDNYYVLAIEGMVEGTLEEVRTRDSRITVEGTNYSKANPAIFSSDEMGSFEAWTDYTVVKDYVDEDVVVYLDLNGKAMVLATDTKVTSTIYGLATWVVEGRTNKLTVFNGEGEEVEYAFETRSAADLTTFAGVKNIASPAAIAVELELNKDTEITTYQAITAAVGLTKEADKEIIMDGTTRLYLEKDTTILKAYNSDGELKPSVIKYDDLINKEFKNAQALYITDSGRDLALLVFVDPAFSATDDTMYAVVTGDRFVRGTDYRVELDVVGKGKAVYTLSGATDVKKGDLVTFRMNNAGKAVVITIKALANTSTNAVVVTDVLTNYINDLRVTSKTLFYKTTSKPALDGTTTFARIDKNDKVVILDDGEGNAMVVLDVTLYAPAVTPPTAITMTTSGSSITVKNIVFDTAATGAKNTYTIRATGDASTTAVYSPTVTVVAGTTPYAVDAEFTVEVVKSGFYDVELIRVADEVVVKTGRLYLEVE